MRLECLGCSGQPAGASHEQNRMTTERTFATSAARLREFISNAGCGARNAEQPRAGATEAEFNTLALELFALQFRWNDAYRRICETRRVVPEQISEWQEIPAVPATAFKELEMTSLAPDERTAVFFSSGTTDRHRSRHFHDEESLAIYRTSLLPWFERHVLAEVNKLVEEQPIGPLDKLPFLALTPARRAAPNSSLVYMFDAVLREFGAYDSFFVGRSDASGAWKLDIDAAVFAIRKSMCANRPLVLLGTAFNFVHLLDYFATNNMRHQLARGSRVLETGGYKGQSREVPKAELHALITRHLGIAPEYIVTEYGMSELSSQAYDRVAGQVQGPTSKVQRHSDMENHSPCLPCPPSPFPLFSPAPFHFPPWARVQIISPETGREVAEGETGLIRIFDLANVRSVMAIQTEDLGVRRGRGFELIGRAAQGEARGCSLMSPASQVQIPQ